MNLGAYPLKEMRAISQFNVFFCKSVTKSITDGPTDGLTDGHTLL